MSNQDRRLSNQDRRRTVDERRLSNQDRRLSNQDRRQTVDERRLSDQDRRQTVDDRRLSNHGCDLPQKMGESVIERETRTGVVGVGDKEAEKKDNLENLEQVEKKSKGFEENLQNPDDGPRALRQEEEEGRKYQSKETNAVQNKRLANLQVRRNY